jgi:hypothetical protein
MPKSSLSTRRFGAFMTSADYVITSLMQISRILLAAVVVVAAAMMTMVSWHRCDYYHC